VAQLALVAQLAPAVHCVRAAPVADLSSRHAGLLHLNHCIETLLWPNRSLGKNRNLVPEESRNVSSTGSRRIENS
jgi:hypothetical protein